MEQEILFNLENNVGYITLNRPKVFNSFNRSMALKLQETLDECENSKEVRCIVIQGEGKAFCAGQDLAEAIDPNGPGLTTIVDEHYNQIILRLRHIEKPIIAAVNGVAAGAGANIAFACDLCIATASANFIQAFSKIGLIPDSGGTFFLPKMIGLQKASALAFLGDKCSAEEADKMNMIYKAVSDESFAEEVKSTAERLASMPTYGIGLTKRAFNLGMDNDLKGQLQVESDLQTLAGKSYDYNEGVNAFLEKRKPNYKGE